MTRKGEWESTPLDNLVEEILDRRGVTPSKLGSNFVASGHRVISAKIVKDRRLDLAADEPRFVDTETYKRWMKTPLMEDDVIVTSEAPLGELAYIRERREWCLGQRLFGIRTRKDRLSGRFLFYAFQSNDVTSDLYSRATGTTVIGIRQTELRRVRIPVPPLPTQRAIAHILGALDDKIELNRKTNETLEAMARALFQSWFVDFDPVRAKAAGRAPEGMDEATAKLFPCEFEQSRWGPLPASWSIAALGDLLTVLETGGRPKGGVGDLSSGVPSIGAESIVGIGRFDYAKTKYVSEEFFSSMKRGLVQNRDVLVYKDGGRPGQLVPHVSMFGDGFPFVRCAINEHVYRVRTGDRIPQSFLYFALSSERSLDEMARKGTGVAVPGLNSTAMRSLEVLVPSSSILQVFDRIAEPLIGRIFSGALQSRALAAIRDALLPKLLSGELAIRDAETFVSRAV